MTVLTEDECARDKKRPGGVAVRATSAISWLRLQFDACVKTMAAWPWLAFDTEGGMAIRRSLKSGFVARAATDRKRCGFRAALAVAMVRGM